MGLRKASEVIFLHTHSSFSRKKQTLKKFKGNNMKTWNKTPQRFSTGYYHLSLNIVWYNDAWGQLRWLGWTFGGQASMTAPIGPDVPYPREIQIYFVFWGNSTAESLVIALLLPLGKNSFLLMSFYAHVFSLPTSLLCEPLKVMELQEYRNEYEMEVYTITSALYQVYIHRSSGKFQLFQ